jgi:hypothetical protein
VIVLRNGKYYEEAPDVDFTSPKMGVDAHIPSGSTETLPFTIRDVLFGLGITVLLGHTKINDMHDCFVILGSRVFPVPVNSLLDALVPARPMRKLSGLISR